MRRIPQRPSEAALLATLIVVLLVALGVVGVLAHAGMLAGAGGTGFRHP